MEVLDDKNDQLTRLFTGQNDPALQPSTVKKLIEKKFHPKKEVPLKVEHSRYPQI
jgi:hypothetical protein